MDSCFDAALWISLNYRQSTAGCIKVVSIYSKMCTFFKERNIPVPTKDIVSKLVQALFLIPKCFIYENSLQFTAFRNLEETTGQCLSSCTNLVIPPYCNVSNANLSEFCMKCLLTTCIDGKQLSCDIEFLQSGVVLTIMGRVLRSRFFVPPTQHSINSVIDFSQNLRFCRGMSEKFPCQTNCVTEVWSIIYDENSSEQRFRSKQCKILLSFLQSSTASCDQCANAYRKAKQRHLKTVKEHDTNPSHDTTLSTLIDLHEDDAADITDIITVLLSQQQVPSNLRILLENQIRNSKDMDARQRKWDPEVISVALGLYLKSPAAYEQLKNTNMLILPSKRLLQYYKNSVKQSVGISVDNLQWMTMECSRQSVPDYGKHGGLVIDEMAIQDDLIIERVGDVWKLVGMVDMGETNNNIAVICKKDKKVELATHVLQFVFHGFTGFRWPVAYFGSNPATAHQLYTTFWECVDVLCERGFTVDYVMLDGASTNRTFTGMLFHGPPADSAWMFHDIFDRHHQICAIQDIMHCIKKLRNNIESSKAEHKAAPGRFLILHENPILWNHWEGCFNFNCQSGFRIHHHLSKEHLEITPASKMRNKLAKDVLDREMLYLMKAYQQTLENPDSLSSSILLLEHTSILVDIFCTKNRPISELSDTRLKQLKTASEFFLSWKTDVEESPLLVTSKHFLTRETAEDLQSSLVGFISLCEQNITSGHSINPGYINSDIVENFFCQQRGIRNGLNTNPTLSQYGPSNTAIILGQSTVSSKCNSGLTANFFTSTSKRALNRNHQKSSKKMKGGMRA